MASCYMTALQMAFAHNSMLMLTVKHWLWSQSSSSRGHHICSSDWSVCVFEPGVHHLVFVLIKESGRIFSGRTHDSLIQFALIFCLNFG